MGWLELCTCGLARSSRWRTCYQIIRFWNDDALKQTDTVLKEILRQLYALTPTLSPRAGRGGTLRERVSRGSSAWWIPARKAPASTLPEALGMRGGLRH
ncbi:MAG: DUF559 domain-containing protein [Betaproteobacteria bacterium]|nr:DUF559 domain-containing protein [Betaproteobacteria bacterium]